MTCKLTPKEQRLTQNCRWKRHVPDGNILWVNWFKMTRQIRQFRMELDNVLPTSMEPMFFFMFRKYVPHISDWPWGPKVPTIWVDVRGQNPGTNKSMERFGYLEQSCWVKGRCWPKFRCFNKNEGHSPLRLICSQLHKNAGLEKDSFL